MIKGIKIGNPRLFGSKRLFHPENRGKKINELKKHRYNWVISRNLVQIIPRITERRKSRIRIRITAGMIKKYSHKNPFPKTIKYYNNNKKINEGTI